MSTLSYQQQYQQVLADLKEVQQEDIAVSAYRVGEDRRAQQAYYTQYWLALYVRYVRLAKQLVALHDTELQPQRRQDMRTVLDSCLGRMLEARHNIVEHCGDYVSLDDTLEEMKLPPAELDPPLPTYILEDRREALMRDRTYAVSLQQHYQETEAEVAPVAIAATRFPTLFRQDPTKALPPFPSKTGEEEGQAGSAQAGTGERAALSEGSPMPLAEAVRVLQLAERGRQARQRATIQLQLYRQQQYAAAYGAELKSLTGRERAATIVQKVALGYLQQKRAKARYQQEQELLGMASTAAVRSDAEKLAAHVRKDERKARQRVNQAELMQRTLEMEEQLRHQEGPKTLEKMLDEVLMHMAQARLEGKAKDGVVDVPGAEEGGTLALLGRPSPATNAGGAGAAAASNGVSSDGARRGSRKSIVGGGAGRKSSATAAAVAGGGGGSGSRRTSAAARKAGGGTAADGAEAPSPLVPRSAFLDQVTAGTERYNAVWKARFQRSAVEQNDLDQPYDETLLRQELLEGPRGVMQDLRQCVDQLVMMEVTNLKERLEAEKNAKKKGGRKAKKEKKPKKPKLRDPMKGESVESMLNTAIYENKLQLPPPEIKLSSFVGPVSVAAGPLDRALRAQGPDEELKKKWARVLRGWTPEVEKSLGMSQKKLEELFNAYTAQGSWLRDPSAGEVRAAAAEYGVLPLGSQVVHDLAPHPTGLFLYGAPGSGKTLLAYAIANESGARFFNLSAGNFLTTKGMPKMVQVVFYAARLTGPSIIYFDHIEKIFPGKGGKGKKNKNDAEAVRGKKLKKEILKGITSLQPTDRVLLIATSTEPWTVDMAVMGKFFQRALHLAPPDYATREMLLKAFVNERLQDAHLHPLCDTAAATTRPAIEALRHVAALTDGFSAQQLRECVTQTLPTRRLERLPQHPLKPEEFVPAMSTTAGMTPADRQRYHDFQATLPVVMRRANPMEDFQPAEDGAAQRKTAAAPKKK
jgi:IQ and AAA domain-containing protein